ncbi:MAG: PadR family transcriptional regulator [Paludibacteraceae bacterium]|nr:PadR family transcriptional regulator [Paludibacteraceae bacterium]
MIDNLRSQMKKGLLEYCILLILQYEPMYATEILECLKVAQLVVVEGTLYPLLSRLKNVGVLAYYWQESPAGPPRKYFKITPEGELLLQELEKEWGAMQSTIQSLHANNNE